MAALAEYYHLGVFGGAGAGRRGPGASGLVAAGAGARDSEGSGEAEARAVAAGGGGRAVPGLHVGTAASAAVGVGVIGPPGTPGSVPGTPILSAGLTPSLIPLGFPGVAGAGGAGGGGVGIGIGGSPGHVAGSPHVHHRVPVDAWEQQQHQRHQQSQHPQIQHHHHRQLQHPYNPYPHQQPSQPARPTAPGHLPGVDRDPDPGMTYDAHLTPAIASQIASAKPSELASAPASVANSSILAAHGSPFTAMEQIETQVSDLRYLSQAPVALSPPGGAGGAGVGIASAPAYDSTPQPQAQNSPGSASIGDNSAQPGSTTSNSNKRKSVDDGSITGSKQTRSKRNRVSCLFPLFSIDAH